MKILDLHTDEFTFSRFASLEVIHICPRRDRMQETIVLVVIWLFTISAGNFRSMTDNLYQKIEEAEIPAGYGKSYFNFAFLYNNYPMSKIENNMS